MSLDACREAKAEGNAAYSSGNLDLAIEKYTAALDSWDECLEEAAKPTTFSVGDIVVYNRNGFARVESAFVVMDEYFAKDLGTDKPIWVGDEGGDLRRFSKADLQPVDKDLFDLRIACTQNLAAVMLKKEDFKLAIKWSDEALRMDGKAPKALMRKGSALLKDGQAGPASDVLLSAQLMSPKDPEVKKLLREAEKARGAGWICANGCCGPWGLGNHMLAPPPNLNPLGKGKIKPAPVTLGPMKFGPSTAGQKIVADDDSDDECSTCSSNDEEEDCSKKQVSSPDSQAGATTSENQASAVKAIGSDAPPQAEVSLDEKDAAAKTQVQESSIRPEREGAQVARASAGASAPASVTSSSADTAKKPTKPPCPSCPSCHEGVAASGAKPSTAIPIIAGTSFALIVALVAGWIISQS